jgi:hypothetical protein
MPCYSDQVPAAIYRLSGRARGSLTLAVLAAILGCGDLRAFPVYGGAGGAGGRDGMEPTGPGGPIGGGAGAPAGIGGMGGGAPPDGRAVGIPQDPGRDASPAGGRPGTPSPDMRVGGAPDVRDSSPAPVPDEIAPFEGAWEFNSGTFSLNCNGQVSTDPATGPFQLRRGTDAPLWHVDEGCIYRLDVSGGVASYRRNPPCVSNDPSGPATLTPVSGGIRVDGPAVVVQATFQFVGVVGGVNATCGFTVDARAIKVPGVGPGT